MLQERGATVLFEAPGPLERLLRRCTRDVTIVSRTDEAQSIPHDVFSSLLSVPYRFGTTRDTIPDPGAYLSADPKESARWRERFFENPDFKAGIAWQGNPKHPLDRLRSVPVSRFARLCALDGVRVYSLQKGPGQEQLRELPATMELTDLGSVFDDMADTAAAIENLDLVVSVDSAVAHLAAAMGKPTWIPIPTVPDWRWLLEGEKSPWYGSVRLFRQEHRGEWQGVFRRIEQALGERVAKSVRT
jgi:hypothetical protein